MKFRNRQGARKDRPLKSERKGERHSHPLHTLAPGPCQGRMGQDALGSPDTAAGAQEMLHQPMSTWEHLDLQSDLKTFSLWSQVSVPSMKLMGNPFLIEALILFGGSYGCSSDGKESVWNAGHPGSILGSGMSPAEGRGNPLQCSCLENPMDRGAWGAMVHGVAKRQTRLSDGHTRTIMELSLEWPATCLMAVFSCVLGSAKFDWK